MDVTVHEWLSISLFLSCIAAGIGFILSISILIINPLSLVEVVIYAALAGIAFFLISSALSYLYPLQMSKSVEQSIESELPFVLHHMSAIASAGIPLENMFQLLSGFEEYRVMSRYSRIAVRDIKGLGMSSSKAISHIMSITPSKNLRQLLSGMQSVAEKGGRLDEYLAGIAEKSVFGYRLRREEYANALSIYAEVYTSLLIAAPLIFVIIISLISSVGGSFIGLGMEELFFLMTFLVIPLLNIGFIGFIHFTRPEG